MFTGRNTFRGNSADSLSGGGFSVVHSTLNFTGNTTFRDNFGGGIETYGRTLKFSGNHTFRGNSAESNYGGGIHVNNSTLNFTGNNTFIENSSKHRGGGIYCVNFLNSELDWKHYFHNKFSYIWWRNSHIEL